MIPQALAVNNKEEIEEEATFNYEKTKDVKWYDRILLNRPLKVILGLLLVAVLAPILIYRFLFLTSLDLPPSDGHSFGSCLVPRTARLLCGPEHIPQSQCDSQCCYDMDNNVCYHRFPSRFSYLMDQVWTEQVILRPRIPIVPYASQNSVSSVRLSIDEISPTHLSITFYDARAVSLESTRIANKSYSYQVSSPELNVVVNGINGSIFNTIRGPLIASDNIWEIAFKLTEETIYGLGELPLKPGTTKMIYNHDKGLSGMPVIYAKSNGTFHGLLIDVVDPTQVSIGIENQVIVRSITKTGLKFHLYVGPKPKDVMKQIMSWNNKSMDLDYWMLGAHICNDVSETEDEALTFLTGFITNATRESVPYDSHCGTRSVVFKDEFNVTEAGIIESGARLLRNALKKFVPHVSPYIHYEGKEETLDDLDKEDDEIRSNGTCTNLSCKFDENMLRLNSTDIYKGIIGVKNHHKAVYPDYANVTDEFLEDLWRFNFEVDGIVLQNNWPLDESIKFHTETYSHLPYFNTNFEVAFNHTPLWNATRPYGDLYLYGHNEYGNNFIKTFEKIFNDTPIWSTSQRMRSDIVVNRQEIDVSWANLKKELVEAALGGISGQWLWSSPVCGDTKNFNTTTQVTICVKWYMASTYLPLIKIHSKSILRHPFAFAGVHKLRIIDALNKRLSLLPYFYTVLQDGPLLRPMFYQFPQSDQLHDISNQFSVGDCLLIVPNLQPSQSHVHITMPPGSWYEFWSGLKIDSEEGDVVTMTTTEADFMTLVLGGSIVVMQKTVRLTAEDTRKISDYTLVVATEVVNGTREDNVTRVANGTLYLSNDMTLHFTMDDNNLSISAVGEDFNAFCGNAAVSTDYISEINVYGLDEELNNYDNYKKYVTAINLCDLKNGNILYPL